MGVDAGEAGAETCGRIGVAEEAAREAAGSVGGPREIAELLGAAGVGVGVTCGFLRMIGAWVTGGLACGFDSSAVFLLLVLSPKVPFTARRSARDVFLRDAGTVFSDAGVAGGTTGVSFAFGLLADVSSLGAGTEGLAAAPTSRFVPLRRLGAGPIPKSRWSIDFAMLTLPRRRSGAGDGAVFSASLDATSLLRTLTASFAAFSAFSAFVGLRPLSPGVAAVSLAPLLRILLSPFSGVSSLDSPRPCLMALVWIFSLFAFLSLRASIRGVVVTLPSF